MKKSIALMSVFAFLASALPALADTTSTAMKQELTINNAGTSMLTGTLKSMSPTSFTVTSWGGDWMINVPATTKLMRKYSGTSSMAEFTVGDMVQVKGKVDAAAPWTIDAQTVQDNSIQTLNASFSGTVSNLNGSTLTLTTKSRGVVQVTLNTGVKIMMSGKTGMMSDIANGTMIGVSGVWNTQKSMLWASKVTISKKAMMPSMNAGMGTGK